MCNTWRKDDTLSKVFLSHSHQDKPFARRLASDLRARGHVVWIDEAEIGIGDSLIAKIREGLDEVDFVAAILSVASISSPWVTRELDIACNREIREGRVVVLPLLIEDVVLPGFLEGKFYGDFRDEGKYLESLDRLLAALGPGAQGPDFDLSELERLRGEAESARATVARYENDLKAHRRAAMLGKSGRLRAAIEKANAAHPLHSPINTVYAFELMGAPITLDYLLWSVGKAMRKGSSPVESMLTIEDKWDQAEAMLAAYSDMLAVMSSEPHHPDGSA